MNLKLADTVVIAILAILLFIAVRVIVRNKKAGRNSCGCGCCSSCSGCKYANSFDKTFGRDEFSEDSLSEK